MKSVADVLAEGREYLEKNGWWKGGLRGPNGKQACALGALMFSQFQTECTASRTHQSIAPAVKALENVIGGEEITNWNDQKARTKQEVLDAFAKAEKIERAGFDPEKGIIDEIGS